MVEEQKRWRAEEEHEFYYIKITHEGIDIYASWEESFDDHCQLMYNFGNYFRNKEEALAAAEDIRKVLLRHAGELHDFTWAVAEMKKGNKVIRASDKGRFGDFHCNVENCIYLKDGQFINDIDLDPTVFDLEQMEATDWEIYEEE